MNNVNIRNKIRADVRRQVIESFEKGWLVVRAEVSEEVWGQSWNGMWQQVNEQLHDQ